MNAYIAYSYKTDPKLIKKIFMDLQNSKVHSFFPESIELHAISIDDMKHVDNICCEKIRDSDFLIAIYPFGISVSIEIGRFLELKANDKNKKRTLIIFDISKKESDSFNKLRSEAMLIPHVDAIVASGDQLLTLLNTYAD